MEKKNNKYDMLTDEIVNLVGGKENVSRFSHCITRLRFDVKDKGLVKAEQIEKIGGVVGVRWSGDQLQIIIGNNVGDVYDVICKKHGLAKAEVVKENLDEPKKKFSVASFIDMIAGCVIPLVPILMGAGMIKVFCLLAVQAGILDAAGSTYKVLDFVNNAAFYFLPVFVGATAAKKFGANIGMGMLIGAMLIHPTFIASVGEGLTIFNIPIYNASYSSTIFPTILSVWVMSKIEKLISRYSPSFLRAILVPTLTLLVMIPLTFCLLAPIGSFVGIYLAEAVMFAYAHLGFLAYGLFGLIWPVLVVFGMHTALTPYAVQAFATAGYEPTSIMSFVSTCTLTATCVAVALRTRNKNMKSTAFSSAITAIVGGVTEPALYGVALRFRKPFVCALIGNFIGGCVVGLFHVQCYALGPANILAIAKFIDVNNGLNFAGAMLGSIVAFAVTFILIYFFAYRKADPMEGEK